MDIKAISTVICSIVKMKMFTLICKSLKQVSSMLLLAKYRFFENRLLRGVSPNQNEAGNPWPESFVFSRKKLKYPDLTGFKGMHDMF